jgi:C-terminal processing protease CtpA/Prc
MIKTDTLTKRTAALVVGLFATCAAASHAQQTPAPLRLEPIPVASALNVPTTQGRQIARVVTAYLAREHVTSLELNDEMARRTLIQFLQQLDPHHLYFLQSDIDGFVRSRDSLDDSLKQGDLSAWYDMYKLYLQRLRERVQLAERLLNRPHDFNVEEELATDRTRAAFVRDDTEAEELWRKWVKYELLLQKAAGSDAEAARMKVAEKYRTILQDAQKRDDEDLMEVVLHALATAYDPHSSYKSPKSLTNFRIAMQQRQGKPSPTCTGSLLPVEGRAAKIVYVHVPAFYLDFEGARKGLPDYTSASRDLRLILEGFRAERPAAVVLDLRDNPGGALAEAINVAGLFIDEGPIVQIKDRAGAIQSYSDKNRGMAWSGPLVVLTSKTTSGTAEVVAAAIQDHRRGLVVGDRSTHGLGTVQSLLDLGAQLFREGNAPNLGVLSIAVARFYRPSGDSTQRSGVAADLTLPSLTELEPGESDLNYALEFDRVPTVSFTKAEQVQPAMLTTLRTRSAARVNASPEFAKLLKDIDQQRLRQLSKTVPLNQAKFLALMQQPAPPATKPPDIFSLTQVNRDAYLNEALEITADYAAQLQTKNP